MATLINLSIQMRFDALGEALIGEICEEPFEVVVFAFCDARGGVKGMRRICSVARGWVDIPMRRIIADVLILDAHVLVMAHNHPGGEPWPSRADRSMTARISRALAGVDSRLYDHLVVGRDGKSWSFRGNGLL